MKNLGDLNFPLCLAPMVGLTHVALRRLIQDYTPPEARVHWPTEMLNSRKVPFENLKKTPETLRCATEKLLVPQILGNEEEPIRLSVQRLVNEWGAEGIDINMGCPVQKALKHNYGVALMGDSDYAARVVEMTKRSTSVPVSVKLRAVGKENSADELSAFVKKLTDAGADWITLHPRVAEQQRRGTADWSQIKELKKNISVPLIGNGDIQTFSDVKEMLAQTDADMVMAGRALAAKPWMMSQMGESLGMSLPMGSVPITPEEQAQEYGRCLLRLVDYSEKYFMTEAGFSDGLVLRKIGFYIKVTHVWLEFGHFLMAKCSGCKNLVELRDAVKAFFSVEQRMYGKTDLRQ